MEQQVLGGRYVLQEQIGSGGMARVFRAVDQLLGREVAVKVLKPEAAADPSFTERFKREARAAAALNHPNVVSIYDWGTADGADYLVMEYVPGQNLKELLRARRRVPEIEALEIGEQIAAALDAAHRRGFVHRDVKPHNVLLDSESRAKVTDFGIVRATGVTQLTAPNAVCGTVQYLSPEQATGQAMDQRSDVYSLGVVLYELLTGKVPFEADSAVAVALCHVHDRPQPLRDLYPDISPATERVVLKALAKDPAERYQTAAEMRRALQEARLQAQDAGQATRGRGTRQKRDEALVAADPWEKTSRVVTGGARRKEERREGRDWGLLLGLPVLLLAIVAGAAFAAHFTGLPAGGHTHAAGHVGYTATPKSSPPVPANHHARPHPPAPVLAAQARPTSAPTSTAAPTAAPTAIPTVPPTAAPTAPPTVLPAAPPVVPPTPSPTPQPTNPPPAAIAVAQPPVAGASGPRRAVESFYRLISGHQFDQAVLLWSQRMQRNYPPEQNIDHRFAGTQQIVVVHATVVRLDRSAGQATVAVDLLEYDSGSSTPIHWTGTWDLVRTPSGWLLDWPNLHQSL